MPVAAGCETDANTNTAGSPARTQQTPTHIGEQASCAEQRDPPKHHTTDREQSKNTKAPKTPSETTKGNALAITSAAHAPCYNYEWKRAWKHDRTHNGQNRPTTQRGQTTGHRHRKLAEYLPTPTPDTCLRETRPKPTPIARG